MSRDPYKRRRERQKASPNPIREPKREYYPDVKPKNDHSGERHGKLVIIRPYCKIERPGDSGAIWEWESRCDCGNIKIFRNLGRVSSCGCLKGEKRREWVAKYMAAKAVAEKEQIIAKKRGCGSRMEPVKKARFNRLETCNRLPFQCKFYSECQDERLEGKPTSSRYRDGCYTPGRDEKRCLGEVAP